MRTLLWFRNDLRVSDNPLIAEALKLASAASCNDRNHEIICLYCFDPRYHTHTQQLSTSFAYPTRPVQASWGATHRTGQFRSQFIIESVTNLRKNLEEKMNCGLYVCNEKPEIVIPKLLAGAQEATVIVHKEDAYEEIEIEKLVEQSITDAMSNCVFARPAIKPQYRMIKINGGKTLHHPDDLPYDSTFSTLSNTFTHFRTTVEKKNDPVPVPPLINYPTQLGSHFRCLSRSDSNNSIDGAESFSTMPSLGDLGFSTEEVTAFYKTMEEERDVDSKVPGSGVMPFCGGEDAAQDRVQKWMFDGDHLKDYFDIRNGMLGEAYSSKLSPWLALGCISARQVYYSSKQYEDVRGISNKSTYWITFELLWRDFFRYLTIKLGREIFYPYGNKKISRSNETHSRKSDSKSKRLVGNKQRGGGDQQTRAMRWSTDEERIRRWKTGTTGQPLVDANMRELLHTGWMSNRGRQNVASYLVHDLGIDWRVGADHFESLLLDHDVYSNYGNWFAAAGLTGGRLNKFNCVKQSHDYDATGKYIRHWIPELAKVPAPQIFQPHLLSIDDQQKYGLEIGVTYPSPSFDSGVASKWGKIIMPRRVDSQCVKINYSDYRSTDSNRNDRSSKASSNKRHRSRNRSTVPRVQDQY